MQTRPQHKICEKKHFIKRAKERLGLDISEEEYFKLRDRCADRRFAHFCGRNKDRKHILRIIYGGFMFCVIYNPMTDRLVTILPGTIKNLK